MKTINLQRAILVDLDWLEQRIKSFQDGYDYGDEEAGAILSQLRSVRHNSIPASKVAEICMERGYELAEVLRIEARTRYANTFLNSPIQIP